MSLKIMVKETTELNIPVKTKKQANELRAIAILTRNKLSEMNPRFDEDIKIQGLDDPFSWSSVANFCGDLEKFLGEKKDNFLD